LRDGRYSRYFVSEDMLNHTPSY